MRQRTSWPAILAALALALAVLALAGCGGDDEDEPAATQEPAPAETQAQTPEDDGSDTGAEADTGSDATGGAGSVKLEEFAFDPSGVSAAQGETLRVENVGAAPHNLTVEGEGGEELAATATLDAGKAEDFDVEVPPGEYTIYCSVAGHRENGMEGTLTVR